MAATQTLLQLPESLQPRHGVVTLVGYGIQVRVDRGHLLVEDGIGVAQTGTPQTRLPVFALNWRGRARYRRSGQLNHRQLLPIGPDGVTCRSAFRETTSPVFLSTG